MEIQCGWGVKDFRDLKGLAEGSPVDLGHLSDHGELSPRGVIRADHSAAALVFFDLSQSGEGWGRNCDAELARFCSIAMGSTSELDYRLLLARDLKLINPKDYGELAQRTREVKRLLGGSGLTKSQGKIA